MVALAGEKLNIVLDNLKRNFDLKINRVTQPLIVQAGAYGPFALEADFLRTYDLFYQIPSAGGATASSSTIFLDQVTMEQWDAEWKSPVIADYPYEFATDLSTQAQIWSGGTQGSGTLLRPGTLSIYPQSSGQLILTHRYMRNQPDLVSPHTSLQTPWFPYTEYLIKAGASQLMSITGDDRQDLFAKQAQEMLRPHLIMEGDEQETVRSVRLDPRRFRSHKGLRPTKAQPF